MDTCKICKTNKVDYYGGLCEECIVAYQAGEKAERIRMVNEIKQRLGELERWLDGWK